jgi:small multidrug resistance pump
MEWFYLMVAIALEIAGTACTKLADGFRKPLPSFGVLFFYVTSLAIFTLTVKKIDVGTAYAVWSGVGTAAIAIIGFLAFKETVTPQKVFFIVLIIVGAVGLQVTGGGHEG